MKQINKDIKCCPYCGGETYYIKQRYSGCGNYYFNFDGTDTDNSEFYENSDYKLTSKYAWCADCDKRLFKLED